MIPIRIMNIALIYGRNRSRGSQQGVAAGGAQLVVPGPNQKDDVLMKICSNLQI